MAVNVVEFLLFAQAWRPGQWLFDELAVAAEHLWFPADQLPGQTAGVAVAELLNSACKILERRLDVLECSPSVEQQALVTLVGKS